MKLSIVYVFLTNALIVSAKIHGGPRGRFDNVTHRRTVVHHVSARHTYYSYHPPAYINFMCRHCAAMTSYPVFHGLPPTYVYKYRESGSRFGELLTGLALYNLGRASDHWHHSHYYTQRRDEKCSLQVIDRSHFEETSFPCFMMSSFLEKTVIEKDTKNTFDIASSQIKINSSRADFPLVVTREQECVIWYNATADHVKSNIPCALLKEYANTMIPSGVPVYIWLPITLGIVITISACCQCCCKKKKVIREETPLNQQPVEGYCLNQS